MTTPMRWGSGPLSRGKPTEPQATPGIGHVQEAASVQRLIEALGLCLSLCHTRAHPPACSRRHRAESGFGFRGALGGPHYSVTLRGRPKVPRPPHSGAVSPSAPRYRLQTASCGFQGTSRPAPPLSSEPHVPLPTRGRGAGRRGTCSPHASGECV